MFKLLGALVAMYIVYCFVTGAVYAKAGAWGRTYRRDQDAVRYWGALGSYCALVVMLLFLF